LHLLDRLARLFRDHQVGRSFSKCSEVTENPDLAIQLNLIPKTTSNHNRKKSNNADGLLPIGGMPSSICLGAGSESGHVHARLTSILEVSDLTSCADPEL